jgi:putative membrane protein insertion efficiency factor
MIAKLLALPIKFYRRCISPYKPPCCRFYPTCSQYALDALEEWGAFRGFFLAVWRVLRCNPFCKGGFDPVPVNPKKKRK